ncbi:kelch repeat-containing protein [uncultured Maricaulis sp.]|uniref:Kelch repeat-containing protein n=1 Tax=uncultured Maricaulis sp. TaxID=174710 RepID=UPI0025D93583|nr:kelch repeat-containing protein [uncultured Maricaulis sp.]
MAESPLTALFALLSLALVSAPAYAAQSTEPEAWAHLPEPVTNNAVAGVELDGRLMAYSFAGLHEGKTWRDVTADAYACDLDARTCREIGGLPDGVGRLASVAVTVRGQIYVFGGYTVAEDGSERSTPEVWRFDPASETYTHITDMPVPVDDTVALPFRDRYIYLVSGWHDTDNVDLVQVYDVEEDHWFEATPFPGAPVFGHAGAIHPDGHMLICGGTAVVPPTTEGGRRSFAAIDDCWTGQVADNLHAMEWQPAPPIPGGPFYRGAAFARGHLWIFVAATDNAYNYSGMGYDGVPSEPRGDASALLPALHSAAMRCPAGSPTRARDSRAALWSQTNSAPLNVMDIRGIVSVRTHATPSAPTTGAGGDVSQFILGGMGPDQTVLDIVRRLPDTLAADIMANPRPVCPSSD